jgi:hypothetical protein
MTDDTASTQQDANKTAAEHDTSNAPDPDAAAFELPEFLKFMPQERTAWSGMTAAQRQIEKITGRATAAITSGGPATALEMVDRHARMTERLLTPLGRWSALSAATAAHLPAVANAGHFSSPLLASLDQSPLLRAFQSSAGGIIQNHLPKPLFTGDLLGARFSVLSGVIPSVRLPDSTGDAHWSKGILRVNQHLPGLLAAQLQGFNTILGLNALRFVTPSLDMQLFTVSQTFSDQGWLIDALLLSVAEEELQAVTELLESALEEEQPDQLLTLLHSVRPALTSNVEIALRELLSPEDAEDFIENALHVFLFALLDEAGTQGRAYAMVPQAALARTEGVFKRAMHRTGRLTQLEQQVLFGNRTQDAQARDEVLEALHDTFSNQPYQGKRDAVRISALERFRQQRTSLTSRGEGPIPTRHHTLHDGVGTGTHENALRTFFYFCSVVLILQTWLIPPSPSGASGAIQDSSNHG